MTSKPDWPKQSSGIALIGHGYIGTSIARRLEQENVRFDWISHASRAWWHGDPAVIVNAAGFTGSPNVDECETRRTGCLYGNVSWPLELENLVGDTPVIHIGSGCVYDGYGPWTEEHAPNFVGSWYSRCKAAGQLLLEPYLRKSYLLRIRMPFGREEHPRNLLTKLRSYPRLVDTVNSISYVEDVAAVAVHFARTLPPPGIYNVVNPVPISTKWIAKIVGIEKEWFDTHDEFMASGAVRAPRSNCALDTRKLQAIYPLRTARDVLLEIANAPAAASTQ